jgi:dihydroorotate dehydrogenase (NAD+) catalytic subunit
VHAALPNIPLIGGGGVFSGIDAFELVLAGASAVSVSTAMAGVRIRDELSAILAEHGFTRLVDAVGRAHDGY